MRWIARSSRSARSGPSGPRQCVTLKRWTHAWAADHGIRELYTWTQRGNDDMRRLNTHLGYQTRTESISLRAALPLPASAGP